MRAISQRELRDDSGKVLRELRDGEEFEVTVNGESVGVLRMTPPPAEPQRFVSADALRSLYTEAPLSADHADAWTRDVRDVLDGELDDPSTRPSGRGGRWTPPEGIDSVTDPAVRAARQRRFDVAAAVLDPSPVSRRVLDAYHDIDAAVVPTGREPRPRRLDLLVAATTRAHDLPLITSDLDDYRGLVGLLDVRSP